MFSKKSDNVQWLVLIANLSVALAGFYSLAVGEQNEPGNKENFELVNLFDYDYYKQTFGKSYNSDIEESTRRCYFYARALAAFASGVSFKYRLSDHYNALNKMSDWIPDERAKTKNKGRHGMMTRSKTRLEVSLNKPLAFMPAQGEQPEVTLRKFLETHANNPVYADLLNQLDRANLAREPAGSRRVKRGAAVEERPRDFSFGKLINAVRMSEDVFVLERPVASNNPHYEGIETMTRGLSDQIQEINYTTFKLPEVEPGALEEQLESSLGSMKLKDKRAVRDKTELADEVFFDHRNSGCIGPIKAQGRCGACYAFASTAFFEWLYCKKMNRLVEFSEQYLLDCAKDTIFGAHGCDGGIDSVGVEFVHNFGLELKANYPYVGNSDDLCPYDSETDLRTTGYIRMEMDSTLEIPVAAWHLFINYTPLYVVVDCDDNFLDYGGGVHTGSPDCVLNAVDESGDYHAMLIVGHGREDNQEYWLIRNSYGEDWGERGYYKLAKDARPECIQYGLAYAFGTDDGFDFNVRPRRNRRRTTFHINNQRHQTKRMVNR